MDGELSYFSRLAGSLCSDAPGICPEGAVTHAGLEQEALRVRQGIVARMAAFGDMHKAKGYASRMAAGIVALLDLLDSSAAASDGTITMIRQTGSLLEALLEFILKYYRSYTDMEHDLPRRQAERFVRDGKKRIAEAGKALERSGADPELRLLVVHALKRYLHTEGAARISFRHVGYFRYCTGALSALADDGDGDADLRLRGLLLSLDFNETGVAAYFMAWLKKETGAAEEDGDRVTCLRRLLKELHQAEVIPDMIYCTEREGLRTAVGRWLEEELWFYTQPAVCNSTTSVPEQVRISTGLTVAQHACLLKLMLEGDVIVHRNHSDVIRWWVGSVGTSRSEALSEGSFRSKFYSVDRGTADAVREVLLKLVQLSRRI